MLFTTSVVAAALLSSTALAAPAPADTATKVTSNNFETLPWKLSNIVIYESASKAGTKNTKPSTVNFDVRDDNDGLSFNMHCNRTVKKGESLYDATYRQCGDADTGFSWYLDSNKNIYITRGWNNPSVGGPTMDYVTCFGNWQLNPHPFTVGNPKQGTNYTQGCMEVYCTAMTA